jgi:hypothetical protein
MSMRNARRIAGSAAIGLLIAVAGTAVAAAARHPARVRSAYSAPCADPYPAARNPDDPLMLPVAPGRTDPLRGANFFVDGPTHGAAAGEIARLLGIDPNLPIGHWLPAFKDSDSWTTFEQHVTRVLPRQSASVQHKIELLQKIANEPEAQRISNGAEGGNTGDFTRKLFCHNFTADPGGIPIISTYFLHEVLGGCPTTAQIDAYMPLFKRHVNAVLRWTGRRPVVYLLELDAIGSSGCISRIGSMRTWEAALRYEVDRFATLPHAVVYVEAGYSDGPRPRYSARILNAIHIRRIRGFFTNDTHENWTSREIKWGNAVSRMTHGAHFVINTAQNGHGPLHNRHPRTEGANDLCNPPGRGLGPRPNTDTGFRHVDAFLWTHVPGNSSGSCNGGPPSGVFWPARAEHLAARANGRLGPGYPSRPY